MTADVLPPLTTTTTTSGVAAETPCVTISTTTKPSTTTRRRRSSGGLAQRFFGSDSHSGAKRKKKKNNYSSSSTKSCNSTMTKSTNVTTATAETSSSSSSSDPTKARKKSQAGGSSNSSNIRWGPLMLFQRRSRQNKKNRTSNTAKSNKIAKCHDVRPAVTGGVYIVPSKVSVGTRLGFQQRRQQRRQKQKELHRQQQQQQQRHLQHQQETETEERQLYEEYGMLSRTGSARTLDTRATRSTLDENDEEDDDEEDQPESPTPVWAPSDEPDFHKGAPILARRPSDVHSNPAYAEMNDQMLLNVVMFKARKLPKSAGSYASNHVMINAERTKRMIQPLRRCPAMDELARDQAKTMALNGSLQHTDDPFELQSQIVNVMAGIHNNTHSTDSSDSDESSSSNPAVAPDDHRIGENVCRGMNVKNMHSTMMKSTSQRNNILDRRFVYMGVGTAKGSDGILYLCQIFSS